MFLHCRRVYGCWQHVCLVEFYFYSRQINSLCCICFFFSKYLGLCVLGNIGTTEITLHQNRLMPDVAILVPSARQTIAEFSSVWDCRLRHMWSYIMMGCHCSAFCFERRQAVWGFSRGCLALLGTALLLLIDIAICTPLRSRKKCKH